MHPFTIFRDPFATPGRQLQLVATMTLLMLASWYAVPHYITPLALPALLIAALAAMVRPDLVAAAFLFLTYFKINEVAYVLGRLQLVITLCGQLLMFALVWHLLQRRTRLDLRGPPMVLAVLWLLLTIGSLVAQNGMTANVAWSDYSKILLLTCALLAFLQSEKHMRLLGTLMVLGGTIVSIVTIVRYLGGDQLVEGTRSAAGDHVLSNPNDLSLLLLLPLAFATTVVMGRFVTWEKVLCAIAAACIMGAIVVCRSRGAFLGTMALFGVLGLHYMRSKVLLLCLGLIAGAVLFVLMDFGSRTSGNSVALEDASAQLRLIAWRAAVNMSLAYPLTGVGIGNFTEQFPVFAPIPNLDPLTAHSIWFLILGEAGWPGLAVFTTFMCWCLVACIRNSRTLSTSPDPVLQAASLATLAGFVSYMVCASFLSYIYQWPLHVLLVLIVAISALAQRSTPAS